MSYIFLLLLTALAFTLFAASALLGWQFQFAVGICSYFIASLILKLLRSDMNIHILVIPFFISYFILSLFDIVFQPEIFNLISFPISFTPILSYIIFRMSENKLLVSITAFIISYFTSSIYSVSLPVLLQNTALKANNNIYFDQNKNTYWWGTSCGSCIKYFSDLKTLVKDKKLHLCCIATSKGDSIRAEGILERNQMESRIIILPSRVSHINSYPTWAIRYKNQEYIGGLNKMDLFPYSFSYEIAFIVLYLKS